MHGVLFQSADTEHTHIICTDDIITLDSKGWLLLVKKLVYRQHSEILLVINIIL